MDQNIKSNILLENKEIEEIVTKLLDKKNIFNDNRIVAMIQAKKNKELIRQEAKNENEVPDLPVIITE
ncbi:27432_t:CDS:2, partial [Racocetra persica]